MGMTRDRRDTISAHLCMHASSQSPTRKVASARLIPAKTDLLSIMGVPLLLDTIENIRRRANPDLRILGVLPTLYHPRNIHDRDVLDELKAIMAAHGVTVFEPVQHSTAYDKAVAEGRAALELWPETPGTQNYQRMALYAA